MLALLVRKEIAIALLSLRFHLTFGLIVMLFAANGLLFVGTFADQTAAYGERTTRDREQLRKASDQLSGVAIHRQHVYVPPRSTGFLNAGFEKYLPSSIAVNAFRGFDPEGSIEGNFLYPVFADLDWSFLIGIIFSLTALLMTYDGISGEREDGTLRLSMSFPVPRVMWLLGKYVGTLIVASAALFLGVLVDVVILSASAEVPLDPETWLRIGLAMVGSAAFLSSFALLGLAVSGRVRQSSTSLVVLLFLWVFLCVLLPSVSGLLADRFAPISRRTALDHKVSEARRDAVRDAPEGTWNFNDGNPHMPTHELRADAMNEMLDAEMKIRNQYWVDAVAQTLWARHLARISPAGAYGYLLESLAGTGVHRVIDLRRDVVTYSGLFHEFVRARDADDADSPHWLNPDHGLFFSRKEVSPEEIPTVTLSKPTLYDSVAAARLDLSILAVMNLVLFAAALVGLIRYDVR